MTTMNGTSRKSLASQLDRFDQMLDGLSEAIPEVVAETVRVATMQAVREAVEAAVTEVLTNPVIRDKIQAAQPITEQDAVSTTQVAWQRVRQMWQGVRRCVTQMVDHCRNPVRQARTYAVSLWQRARAGITAIWNKVELVHCFRTEIVTALGVGIGLAAVALVAGPWIAALLSGIGGFGSALAVQAGLWLRKMTAGPSQ